MTIFCTADLLTADLPVPDGHVSVLSYLIGRWEYGAVVLSGLSHALERIALLGKNPDPTPRVLARERQSQRQSCGLEVRVDFPVELGIRVHLGCRA